MGNHFQLQRSWDLLIQDQKIHSVEYLQAKIINNITLFTLASVQLEHQEVALVEVYDNDKVLSTAYTLPPKKTCFEVMEPDMERDLKGIIFFSSTFYQLLACQYQEDQTCTSVKLGKHKINEFSQFVVYNRTLYFNMFNFTDKIDKLCAVKAETTLSSTFTCYSGLSVSSINGFSIVKEGLAILSFVEISANSPKMSMQVVDLENFSNKAVFTYSASFCSPSQSAKSISRYIGDGRDGDSIGKVYKLENFTDSYYFIEINRVSFSLEISKMFKYSKDPDIVAFETMKVHQNKLYLLGRSEAKPFIFVYKTNDGFTETYSFEAGTLTFAVDYRNYLFFSQNITETNLKMSNVSKNSFGSAPYISLYQKYDNWDLVQDHFDIRFQDYLQFDGTPEFEAFSQTLICKRDHNMSIPVIVTTKPLTLGPIPNPENITIPIGLDECVNNGDYTIDSLGGKRIASGVRHTLNETNDGIILTNLPSVESETEFGLIINKCADYDDRPIYQQPIYLKITQCVENCQICSSSTVCKTCKWLYFKNNDNVCHSYGIMVTITSISISSILVIFVFLMLLKKMKYYVFFNLISHYQTFAIIIVFLSKFPIANPAYQLFVDSTMLFFAEYLHLVMPFAYAVFNVPSIGFVFIGNHNVFKVGFIIYAFSFQVLSLALCIRPKNQETFNSLREMLYGWIKAISVPIKFCTIIFLQFIQNDDSISSYSYVPLVLLCVAIIANTLFMCFVWAKDVFKSWIGCLFHGEELPERVKLNIKELKFHDICVLYSFLHLARKCSLAVIVAVMIFIPFYEVLIVPVVLCFISIEAIWFLYIAFYRPFRSSRVNTIEIINNICTLTCIIVCMISSIDGRDDSNQFKHEESLFTIILVTMLPFSYAFVFIEISVKKIMKFKERRQMKQYMNLSRSSSQADFIFRIHSEPSHYDK